MRQSLDYAIPDLVELKNAERPVRERSEGEPSREIGASDTGTEAGFKPQAIEKTIPTDREELQAQLRKPVVAEKTVCLNTEEIGALLNRWRTQTVAEPKTEAKTVRIDERVAARKATAGLRIEEAKKSRWPVVVLAIGFAVAGVCIFVFA